MHYLFNQIFVKVLKIANYYDKIDIQIINERVSYMSNRERAINIINNMDDSKIIFVLNILDGINGLISHSDEYDLELAKDGEIDNDEEYTSEEVYKILGIER